MRIVYQTEDELAVHLDLNEEPLVIGRSPDADLVLSDDKISRLHCGIRFDGNNYLLKDLGSKNGTYLNGEPIDLPVALRTGDRIRIGHSHLTVQEKLNKGSETILQEIEEEMEHGKGYRTILHEITETNKKED